MVDPTKTTLLILLSGPCLYWYTGSDSGQFSVNPSSWKEDLGLIPTAPDLRFLLMLEFPWILCQAETVLSLSPEDLKSYLDHQWPDHSCEEQTVQRVGSASFASKLTDKQLILSAGLTKAIMVLLESLQSHFSGRIEVIPLLYCVLKSLELRQEASIHFVGMSQHYLLEKQGTRWKKITFFPASLGMIGQEALFNDILTGLDGQPKIYFSDCSKMNLVSCLPLRSEKRPWLFGFKRSKDSFVWVEPQTKQAQWWQKHYGFLFSGLAVTAIIGIAGSFHHLIEKKQLQLTRAERSFKAWQTDHPSPTQSPEAKGLSSFEALLPQEPLLIIEKIQQTLTQLPESSWSKQVEYHHPILKMTFLTTDAGAIPKLTVQLQKNFNQPLQLHYQRSLELAEQSITEFLLCVPLNSEQKCSP